ncbi:hypothetical protein GCM10008018_48440 [Paenibacillus marchantiophytorum]|uniref:Uncharacterized protein n=1 Tax=Paenibacillus marchantiophytorum TaxID=1619310 RepID=A0ABQ1F1P0_9BACL|nr:hypothetical protein [Paenibacillus marchantiophytorum]GFZ96394.1 hypothetical protein GCM10008018_48440 [Paenibacillus marchantiophytorum]
MIPQKILQKINNNHVIIDFEKQTVEVRDEEYSIDDLLEATGTLLPIYLTSILIYKLG